MDNLHHVKWGKTIYIGAVVFLSFALVISLISLYWSLAPYTVLNIKKNPIPVLEKVVKPGGVQILLLDFCKNQDTRGKVEASLVSDKIVVFLPSYAETLPTGCEHNVRAPILLPYIAHHDIYHIHYRVTYVVNPIRTTITEFDTDKFEIAGQ